MQVVRVCLKKRHGFVQLTQNAGLQPFLRRQIVQASAVDVYKRQDFDGILKSVQR